MGRFPRSILIATGGLVMLVAIFFLGLNLYVQSKATQARIQHELSRRLGAPLHIHQISVTPWGGLKLSGITIPQSPGSGAADFLEAKAFQLRVRLFSLFRKHVVIKQVSLVDPTVVWQQDPEGKWRLPSTNETAPKDTSAKLQSLHSLPPPAQPAGTSPAGGEPRTGAATRPQREPADRFAPEIQRMNLKRGNFTFLDRAGEIVGTFQGVDFRSFLPTSFSARGNVKIAKASLHGRFFLEHLQSPFSYEPDVLELSKITAEIGGGQVVGHFAIQPEAADSPFTASVDFRGVQADQLIVNAGGPEGMVQGKLEGNFEASGQTADPNAMTGQGAVFLRDGQVRQYSLLVALGQLLQIEELMQLRLQQAEAKYHISPGIINIDSLVLRSSNIRLSATGTVTFGGKLKLESQLSINDKIRNQLFSMVRDNFVAGTEPGFYALNFQVGGTIDHPKTNLMNRLVGHGLKDLFNEFLGGDKSKKKRAVPVETPEATATPAATPANPLPPAATETPSTP